MSCSFHSSSCYFGLLLPLHGKQVFYFWYAALCNALSNPLLHPQRFHLLGDGLGLQLQFQFFRFRRTADLIADVFPLCFQLIDLGINIFPERKKLLCGVNVTIAKELVVLDIFVQLSYTLSIWPKP